MFYLASTGLLEDPGFSWWQQDSLKSNQPCCLGALPGSLTDWGGGVPASEGMGSIMVCWEEHFETCGMFMGGTKGRAKGCIKVIEGGRCVESCRGKGIKYVNRLLCLAVPCAWSLQWVCVLGVCVCGQVRVPATELGWQPGGAWVPVPAARETGIQGQLRVICTYIFTYFPLMGSHPNQPERETGSGLLSCACVSAVFSVCVVSHVHV